MYKILFVLAIAVGIGACTPEPNDPSGTLEIVFKARYKNAPLVTFQNIATTETEPDSIYFKKFEFFISDIQGMIGGETKTFSDVGYISMTNCLNQTSAEAGKTFTINKIPAGTYTQLNMGIGVSDSVNNIPPTNYPASSPFSISGNYWDNWTSYIFCKVEGDIVQSDGTNSSFLYNSGVNGMHQIRHYARNFTISSGQTTQLVFYINAEDLFFKTGSEIDLVADNQSHSGAVGSKDYNLAKKFIENFADALELQP